MKLPAKQKLIGKKSADKQPAAMKNQPPRS